jgi:hypothetical protein
MRFLRCFCGLVALVAISTCNAEEQNSAPQNTDSTRQKIKRPTTWLEWGADFRVRNEYFSNVVTLTHDNPLAEQNVVRYRAKVWATFTPARNVKFNLRLAAEPREWTQPSFVGAYRGESGLEWRYGIFDILNVKWENAFNKPITITAGRQEISLGDPGDYWFVNDASPNEGSWTSYLDSIRLTAKAEKIRTTFDVIYYDDKALPGKVLPTFGNSSQYPESDQNERGFILYASNKTKEAAQFDAYFIYKHNSSETFLVRNSPVTPGDDADIYTYGGKLTGKLPRKLDYSVEAAYQSGSRTARVDGILAKREISAFGLKSKLTYSFRDRRKNQISAVGEYLTGDSPETPGKDEMFDVLWGRWPRWTDLYLYSYIYETSGHVGQMNNLGRVGLRWSFAPSKKDTFHAMYNALVSPQDTPTRAILPNLFSHEGNFRGHFLQAMLKHQFSKSIGGHLLGEQIWQGDYYAHPNGMTFLRAEILFSW